MAYPIKMTNKPHPNTNLKQKYKIVDNSGNIILTFRTKDTARIWISKIKKDYFRKLKIEEIEE